MEKLNILTIIPVRSGSKRLKNKNIKMLNNKPLMAYSIQAGLGSRYTHDVIVSTDSTEYAKIAKDYGALTPFIRPKEISLDSTSTYEVLEHAINFYKEQNKIFTYILLLQATSPLRESKHIDSAIELALYKNADCVISVCECDHPKEWSNVLGEDLSLDNFIDKKIQGKRSQDLPKNYRLNGAIYFAKIENLLLNKGFYMPNSFAYIMPREASIDIDSEFDFLMAETLLLNKGKL